MDTSSLLLALAALLVGVALGFLLARQSAATRTARAEAERDAAVKRAADVTADREQLAHQFRSLSADALEKQTKQADRAAELRLTPISEALRQLQQRLAEVETSAPPWQRNSGSRWRGSGFPARRCGRKRRRWRRRCGPSRAGSLG